MGATGGVNDSEYTNRAFVSYSRADGVFAKALQRGLEQLAKPRGLRRVFNVFIDVEDLPGGGSLPERLDDALANSQFLIVVASPHSAESYWVNQEIINWRATRSPDTILIVQADGELAWQGSADGSGWTPSSLAALPNALHDAFETEPLWVDFREEAAAASADERAGRLSLDDAGFKVNVARVQACLRGPDVKPSDIVGEDLELWRAAKRRRRIAIVSLAVLTVLSVVGAIVAVSYARRSAAQSRDALSKQLAGQSTDAVDHQLDLGLLLGVEAYRADSTAEAFGSLINAASHTTAVAQVLHGHGQPLRSVAYNSDGSLMASAGADGIVSMRDGVTGSPVGESSPTSDAAAPALLRSLAFSPSRPLIAAADFGGPVRMWDISDPARMVALPDISSSLHHDEALTSVAFSPDGATLASAGGHFTPEGACRTDVPSAVVLTDVASGTERLLTDEPGCIYDLEFSPDGAVLASAHENGSVELTDIATGSARTIDAHPGFRVTGLAFGPDGTQLVTGGRDGVAKVWDLGETPALRATFDGHDAPILSVAFGPNGDVVASGDQGGHVKVWDPATGIDMQALSANHAGDVWSVAFDPQGTAAGGEQRLASASSDGTVLLWRLGKGAPLSVTLHAGRVRSTVFDAVRGVLVSGVTDADGASSLVWQPVPVTAAPVVSTVPAEIFALARDPRSGVVAAGDLDGAITLWDPTTRQQLRRLERGDLGSCAPPTAPAPNAAGQSRVRSLSFDPTTSALAAGYQDGAIVVIADPTAQGSTTRCEVTGGGPAYDVEFSPRGGLLATSGGLGRVGLWDLANGTLQRVPATTAYVQSLGFSPDGTTLAIGGSDRDIVLFDVDARTPIGQPLKGHTGSVFDVRFHPDGSILASASADGTVRLWSATTNEPLTGALDGRSRSVYSLEWIAGGSVLISGGSDNGTQLWDLQPVHLKDRACAVAGRNLTTFEWTGFLGPSRPYRSTCASLPPGNTTG